jgi:predicted SAM-dependent methyltransferase
MLPLALKEAVKKALARRRTTRYTPLQIAVRELRTELRIAWLSHGSARQLQALSGRKGLRINLGCGNDIRPGWINIDLALMSAPAHGMPARLDAPFINHDLRQGLPLAYDSCDYIYSSHFFEHLEYHHGIKLMADCHRALSSSGVFRIALPDFRTLFDAYLRGDEGHFAPIEATRVLYSIAPEIRTLVDYVNYAVYQYGEHKYIYDQEKLGAVLRWIGFRSVVESAFQAGVDLDTPLRRQYSFYLEAIK